MNIQFQEAKTEHVVILLRLMKKLYEHDQLHFDEKIVLGALLEILTTPAFGKILLIKVDKEEVGYMILTYDFSLEFGGRTAFIDELFVLEVYRDRGIGKAALAYAENFCWSEGIKSLHLMVEHANQSAKQFYEQNGFRLLKRSVLVKEVSSQDRAQKDESTSP